MGDDSEGYVLYRTTFSWERLKPRTLVRSLSKCGPPRAHSMHPRQALGHHGHQEDKPFLLKLTPSHRVCEA